MTSIRFLGTGGARWVVARQIRASGGMWMRFGGSQVHVDPGPGALVRALSTVPPCEPQILDAIALSHKHLDHAGDVNVMIEAMTQGGWRPRGAVFAPNDAYDGEPVVFPYLRRYVPRMETMAAHAGPFAVAPDLELRASLRLQHPVECYGMHFRYAPPGEDERRVSYLPCTRFFPEIIDDYAAQRPDVLILNVLLYERRGDVDHLCYPDARELIAGIRPRVAVMSHFGTRMLERNPPQLARALEGELGIRVIAARDGLLLDVDTEVAAVAG